MVVHAKARYLAKDLELKNLYEIIRDNIAQRKGGQLDLNLFENSMKFWGDYRIIYAKAQTESNKLGSIYPIL